MYRLLLGVLRPFVAIRLSSLSVSKDITASLKGWDFDPDRVSVRIVRGDDGRDKIQMRLDLGLLQMEFDGRPDGRRIEDCESWLEYYRRCQVAHDAENPDGAPFQLESIDCQRLLREGVQYYQRYISFWHLERYELCARDTTRNLRLFGFVRDHAKHRRDRLQFEQWLPYVTMMHARAVATPLLAMKDFIAALGAVDAGISGIKRFLDETEQSANAENCAELAQLLRWRDEIAARAAGRSNAASAIIESPESKLERLREELERAILEERFEDAALLRDQIREQADGGNPT